LVEEERPQELLSFKQTREHKFAIGPKLDMDVAPPGSRIIVEGNNIPIVELSAKDLDASSWDDLDNGILEALKDGVVLMPGTQRPGGGENFDGNAVITGHSSTYPWLQSSWGNAFAVLHSVDLEDKIIVYYRQKKFIYQIDKKYEVTPDNIDVLRQTDEHKLTLITCTPIGTTLRRLVLEGHLVEM